MILRRRLQSKGKLIDSITMRSRERYIADCMMESYSVGFHTEAHEALRKAHVCMRGTHQPGPKHGDRTLKTWLLLVKDDF